MTTSMARIRLLVPILGVLAAIALVAAAEVALRVADFRLSAWYLNESLFTPDGDGVHVHTRPMFTDPVPYGYALAVEQRFTVAKAANTLRIAIVGESSVRNLGAATELVERLHKKLSKPVEVLNFGFGGCGSERALTSLQEAVQFNPDAILVYLGHNEFRSISNPVTLIDGKGHPLPAQPAPPPLRVAQWLTKIYLSIWPVTTESLDKQARRYSTEEKEIFYRVFRGNLTAMLAAARLRGIPVVLATAAYSYTCPLKYMPAYPNSIEASGWDAARLEDELRQHPGNSTLEMFLGYMRLRDQKKSEARELLDKAFMDEERPLRATARINDIIRSVAHESGAPLVDVYAAIGANARGLLPGFDLFSDYCHLNDAGNSILMSTAATTLEKVLISRKR